MIPIDSHPERTVPRSLTPVVAAGPLLTVALSALIAWNWLVALIVMGGAGLLALAYFRPRAYLVLLMATVLLVPISAGLDLSDELPVIFASRPVVAIGLAAWALRRFMRSEISLPPNPLLAPLLLLLAGAALSLPGSVALRISIFRFLALMFEWVGVILLTWEALGRREETLSTLDRLLGIFGILCLVGLVQGATGFDPNNLFFTGYSPTGYIYDSISRGIINRVRSTFPQPIEYAGTLAFVAPVTLMLAVDARGQQRMLYGALFVLMTVNIGLAASLGPLISFAITLTTLWALGQGRRPLALAAALMAAGVLIAAQTDWFWEVARELILDRLNPNTDTFAFQNTAGRIAVVLAALDAFRKYPVFGAGLNTWFVVSPSATFMGYVNGAGNSNENFYAQMLVETGLVGLTAVVFAFGWILVRVWRLFKATETARERRVLAGLFAGLVGYFALNLSANVFGGGAGQSAFALWVTLALGLRCVMPDATDRRAWQPPIYRSSL